VVGKNDDNFKERVENETERSSRSSKRGLIVMNPRERDDENGKQDKISKSMNKAEKGTVKAKDNGEGKDKIAQKENIEVAIEKIVVEKENKAKLDDGAIEKGKREKICEEEENDEIKEVKGKSEVLKKKKGDLVKDKHKQNGKIIMKLEIGNEIVEKELTEQSIGEAKIAAVENVNKRKLLETRPVGKVETEQAEGDKAVADASGIEKSEESNRMVKRANEPELANKY